MKVETFEIDEVAIADDAELLEARTVADRLGLAEQFRVYDALISAKSEKATATLFRPFSEPELVVYATLFDQHTELSKYQHPIPPRALLALEKAQALKHPSATDKPMFLEFVVWHTPDIRFDPVLVGMHTPDLRWTYNKAPYPIARWGDSLDEWPAMLSKFRDIATSKARRIVAEAQALLQKVEAGDVSAFSPSAFSPTLLSGMRV